MFCRIAKHIPSLDLGGIVALVGSSASAAALPYTCIIRGRLPYLNTYVTPGTLGLAYAVLTCINWRPAQILAGAGETRSMLELYGLKASGTATYVGLKSGTSLQVRGIAGDALVPELVTKGKKRVDAQHAIGRQSGRPTLVIWADIISDVDGEVVVWNENGALISVIATLVSSVAAVLCALCHEWLSLSVVVSGMLLNAALGFLLRQRVYKFVKTQAAQGSPPGDALVLLNDEPDALCVVRGSENAIQRLFQRELEETGFTNPLPLFLVCVAMMVYTAVVVLGVPHMGVTGQILLLIAIFVGAIVDLVKGSWDGKKAIAKAAIDKYEIKTVSVKKFGNRTAAVACVAAGSSKTDALQRSGVLPATGTAWESWWGVLNTLVQEGDRQDRSAPPNLVESRYLQLSADPLWPIILDDMLNGYSEACHPQEVDE